MLLVIQLSNYLVALKCTATRRRSSTWASVWRNGPDRHKVPRKPEFAASVPGWQRWVLNPMLRVYRLHSLGDLIRAGRQALHLRRKRSGRIHLEILKTLKNSDAAIGSDADKVEFSYRDGREFLLKCRKM